MSRAPSSAETSAEAAAAADLVRRIGGGDAHAEAELVERYSRGVLFLLRRLSGRPDLAEDLHQETFRVVLERLRARSLDEPERLAGFLQGTARNLFLGQWRKAARRKTDDEEAMPEVSDPMPGQLETSLRDEEAALVRQVLAELRPQRDRELLYRFYLSEEPKETVCAELGLSSLHFNRVLYRAKQRFRDLLERAEKRRSLAMHAT